MNDIERRALIGAAGIGAIAALSKAGPLNPPAGAVAGTGRTLDEVYNKIPGANGSGDGRIPIPGGTTGVTISQPGSYVLTGNLSSSGNPLTIAASNVTVDLNGYQVSSTSWSALCIACFSTLTGITVRNGTIRGGSAGVSTASLLHSLFEDLTVIDARVAGIGIGGSSSRNCTIRRCRIMDTGSSTSSTDGSLFIHGIVYTGMSGVIEDCTVSRMFYNGSGTGTLRAISLNLATTTGILVTGCTVTHDAAISGSGLFSIGAGVYRNNTVINFSAPYNVPASWINGGGNV